MLQDKQETDICGNKIKSSHSVTKTVLIAVLVPLGVLIILGAALFVLYPRFHQAIKIRKSKKATELTMDEVSGSGGMARAPERM